MTVSRRFTSRRWRGVAVVSSLVFLCLTFRNVAFSDLWPNLLGVRPGPLGLSVAFIVSTALVRGTRAQALFQAVGPIRLRRAYNLTAIGFLANNLYPARAGELVRIELAARLDSLSRSRVLAMLAVERVFDLAVYAVTVALLPVLAAHGGRASDRFIRLAAGSGLLAVTTLVVLLAAIAGSPRWGPVRGAIGRLPPRAGRAMVGLAQGIRAAGRLGLVVSVLAQTFLIWLLVGATFYCVALAYRLPSTGGIAGVATFCGVASVAGIGAWIPGLPGQVGTFHFFCLQGLYALGVAPEGSPEMAARLGGYVIAVHGIQYLGVNLLGILSIVDEGIGWQGMRSGMSNEPRSSSRGR